MEKIMLSLWRPHDLSSEQWRSRLLGLSGALLSQGANKLRVMAVDSSAEHAQAQRITTRAEPLDGMLNLWLDSASMLPPITAARPVPISTRI